MSHERTAEVGERLQALREQRGLSMRGLAAMCDLSPNAVSLIERGISSPNVSTLRRMAEALQVPITAFFETPRRNVRLVHSRRGERPYSGYDQMHLESLGAGLDPQILEAFEVTLQPGAGSGRQEMRHTGQELVYCLDGQLEYTVEGETHLLGGGDALLFDALLPHSWRNPGSTDARFVMVFGACEDHDSLTRHLQA